MRLRPAPRLPAAFLPAALLLALLAAHGCAALFGPPGSPAPSTADATEPSIPRTVFGCTGIRGTTPADPTPLTLDELRSLVDADLDAVATRDLLARLGPPRVETGAGFTGGTRLVYDRHALALDTLAAAGVTRVRRVELHASPRAFAAPLPDGLVFDMNIEDTYRALGLPDEKRPPGVVSEFNHYRQRGLGVAFDLQGCLRSVAFVVPLAPRTVRFDAIAVEPHRADSGLDGIVVRFVRTVGEFPAPGAPLSVALELLDERGHTVPERGQDGAPNEPRHLAPLDLAAGELARTLHIPYANLVLTRGRHTLRATLRARATIDGTLVDLATVGGAFDLPIDMPALVRAQVGVRSVEVEPGDYDPDPVPLPGARPDLAWSLEREVFRAGQALISSYSSSTRSNTFTATWSQRSPAIVVAPGDRITLCVVDEDVLVKNEIGCVSHSFSEHIALARARTPLQTRKIRHLLLATPKLTPIE